jgi:hypothetical protein
MLRKIKQEFTLFVHLPVPGIFRKCCKGAFANLLDSGNRIAKNIPVNS